MTVRQLVTNRQIMKGDLIIVSPMTLKCDNNENPKCFIRNILTKRQQNIVNREHELLEVAESIMGHEGFSGLTMDKLVAACDYSKGTVYNHFANKEDLFCALSIKGLRFMMTMTKRAFEMEGTLREKCLGLCYTQRLHSQLHPTAFLCALMAKTPAVQERASHGRITIQRELEQEVTTMVDELLSQAIVQGDICDSSKHHLESLCFSLWSMSFGTNALLIGACEARAVARLDAEAALLFNINALLDGLGWHPLSSSWDYQQSWQRIGK
jgi:AcrR family transcriptional regulator